MTKTIDKVLSDELIQWHLSTSAHDICPNCGEKKMGYLGTRERCCLACYLTFTIDCTQKAWLRRRQ